MPDKAKIEFHKLDDRFFVSGQIAPHDIPDLKKLGFKTVINNRPDFEAPKQPTSARLKQSADRAGLAYKWIPISGEITALDIEQLLATLRDDDGPFFAFCRSGARSTKLWALGQAGSRPAPEIIDAAKTAGYDISSLLSQISDRERTLIDPYSDLL